VREVQGDYLCRSCFEDVTGDCSACRRRLYRGNLIEAKDGTLYCEDCWEEQREELEEEPVSQPEERERPKQMAFTFDEASAKDYCYEIPF
jgi:uncharacterized Zn finger protein (UPF0148 family)